MTTDERRPTARINTRTAKRRGSGRCRTCGGPRNSQNTLTECWPCDAERRAAMDRDAMDSKAEGEILAHVASILLQRGYPRRIQGSILPLGCCLLDLNTLDMPPSTRLLRVSLCSRAVDAMVIESRDFRLPLKRGQMRPVYMAVIASAVRFRSLAGAIHAT